MKKKIAIHHCCPCPPQEPPEPEAPTLYLCFNNTGLSYSIVDAVKSGDLWTYTIEVTCDADAQTVQIVLQPISDPSVLRPDCNQYDGTGEFVGSCEIGIIEYGNDAFCAQCGDPSPSVCPGIWRPSGYAGQAQTWPTGGSTTWQVIYAWDGAGGRINAINQPVQEYRVGATLASGRDPMTNPTDMWGIDMNGETRFVMAGYANEIACRRSNQIDLNWLGITTGAQYVGPPGLAVGDSIEIRLINNNNGTMDVQYYKNDQLVFEESNTADQGLFVVEGCCQWNVLTGSQNTSNANAWAGSVSNGFFEFRY